MATNDDEYRSKLIEAVDRVQRQEARQRFEAMPDEELSAWICTSLGLPAGTQFSDENLEMLLEHGNASEGSEPV
jgi:hypothetical protein